MSVNSKLKSCLKKLPFLKQCIENHENLSEIRQFLARLNQTQESMRHTLIMDYLNKNLYEHPNYQDPKKLNKYEHKVYSQNGEDGIIEEIFNRVGEGNKFFVEFGASHGLENNTTNLLLKGWQGVWFEPVAEYKEGILKRFGDLIEDKKLTYRNEAITPGNAEQMFSECGVPKDLDLLVIDIDGNDYWVWQALENFTPRVMVVEYNGSFGPSTKWVMKFNPEHRWDYTSYWGASLKSMELLGKQKGYDLVGCDFRGVNAFFVRQDLTKDKFLMPYTAENHYERTKLNLVLSSANRSFHPPGFSQYEQV